MRGGGFYWRQEGEEARMIEEGSNFLHSTVLVDGDDGAQRCLLILSPLRSSEMLGQMDSLGGRASEPLTDAMFSLVETLERTARWMWFLTCTSQTVSRSVSVIRLFVKRHLSVHLCSRDRALCQVWRARSRLLGMVSSKVNFPQQNTCGIVVRAFIAA